MVKKDDFDYSKLSLPEVIERKTHKKTSFFELETDDKRGVLDYIRGHNVPVRVFGNRWYDVLSKRFFITEFLPSDEYSWAIEEKTIQFDTFDDFYNCLRGDIYEMDCLYGYIFSDEEIKRYNIDLSLLNFDSYLNTVIDDFTFESVNKEKRIIQDYEAKDTKNIDKWFEKLKPFSSYDDFIDNYDRFTSKFDFWDSKYIFFSFVLQKNKESARDFAIRFVCEHDISNGFDAILMNYGREAAIEVIEKFDGPLSYNTNRKRIRKFKDILTGYDSGTLELCRRCGFNPHLRLYYTRDSYCNNKNTPLNYNNYFVSFKDFTSFVKGDLSDADLSEAPISRNELSKYRTNKNTRFPLAKDYESYEVRKKAEGGKFTVMQGWLDRTNKPIIVKDHYFDHFFDFIHFLKGDLSGADLLFCEGLENLGASSGIKFEGARVKSDIAEKIGLPVNFIKSKKLKAHCFEMSKKYEIETANVYELSHPEDNDYSGTVSYVTDIHLLHRFEAYKCKSQDDINYVITKIAKDLDEGATSVNLIGGDTSSDFEIFKIFVSNLAKYRRKGDFFFTLGNHELWGLSEENLDTIVAKYKDVIDHYGQGRMHLVQNNIFFADSKWEEISEEELSSMSLKDLRERTRRASIIIFGGLGFAGMNDEFNADNGIYMDVLDRDLEYLHTTKFFALHEKVTEALHGKNLIVLSHTPMRDWGGKDIHAREGVVYINGHSHRNFFYDDGRKRIYADNQIGYRGKAVSFKRFGIDFNYDWFVDYKDGIYEITKEDYENFYRGVREYLTFNRQYDKLFMIKREKTYMFLMRTEKGSMLILNGGSIKRAGNHSLEYFYENLAKYAESVKLFLADYDSFQKKISSEIRNIGGDGTIHGSIVDIDYYNHLYINPLDGTVTPYQAYSMVSKNVYDNLPSLLKYECPDLFSNYEMLIGSKEADGALVVHDETYQLSNETLHVVDTDMYRISRILKGLQFTTKYNIVRLWNDAFVGESSKENGRLIVSGIIDPDSVPQPPKDIKVRIPKPSKPKAVKPKISKEEAQLIKINKYKSLVKKETEGLIDVVAYRGSTGKADYRCAMCGYAWSTRPDHFKSRQEYTCPKCRNIKKN